MTKKRGPGELAEAVRGREDEHGTETHGVITEITALHDDAERHRRHERERPRVRFHEAHHTERGDAPSAAPEEHLESEAVHPLRIQRRRGVVGEIAEPLAECRSGADRGEVTGRKKKRRHEADREGQQRRGAFLRYRAAPRPECEDREREQGERFHERRERREHSRSRACRAGEATRDEARVARDDEGGFPELGLRGVPESEQGDVEHRERERGEAEHAIGENSPGERRFVLTRRCCYQGGRAEDAQELEDPDRRLTRAEERDRERVHRKDAGRLHVECVAVRDSPVEPPGANVVIKGLVDAVAIEAGREQEQHGRNRGRNVELPAPERAKKARVQGLRGNVGGHGPRRYLNRDARRDRAGVLRFLVNRLARKLSRAGAGHALSGVRRDERLRSATMMKRSLVLCVGVGVASLSACGSSSKSNTQPRDVNSTDGGGTDAGEDTRPCGTNTLTAGTFDFPYASDADGGTVPYSYIVHIPPSYDGTKRTPLVLNWHGLTSNAPEQELFSGMDQVADGHGDAGTDTGGFILVYPNAPDMAWNAGTCCEVGDRTRDDVAFARALVAKIESQACIDTKRVYSTGMSNGAFMSYRLGCEAADLFAAVAPVAGKVGIPDCHPSRPVPLMAFHGTADPLVAYDTGSLSADGYTVPETVQHWATDADVDGCTGDPEQTYDNGSVTCQTWSHCKAGVTATLCTAQGEGHCWPGTAFCPYGAYTTDIDASSQIADFFKKFKLP